MEGNHILNYLALLACIIKKDACTDKMIESITLQKMRKGKVREDNSKKIVLLDTLEEEKMVFNSQGKVAKYLGINRSTVGIYVKSGKVYKNRYCFKSSSQW